MKHTKVTDDWLYEHMPYVDEAMIDELEHQAKGNIRPSKKFERKMGRMLTKYTDNGQNLQAWKVAAACLGIFLSTVGVSVYAGQTGFFETLRTALEDMTLYSYRTKDTVGTTEMKRPGYVPEGYVLQEEHSDQYHASYVYQDSNHNTIVCRQDIVSDGDQIMVDSEYDSEEEIEIPEGEIQLHRYENGLVFCYFEYRKCIYTVRAIGFDSKEIKRFYMGWI